MFTKKYNDRELWFADRATRITGTKLKDLVVKRGTKKKIGFYELIAEAILIDDNLGAELSPMDRGTQLEKEAVDMFRKETGKEADDTLVMWMHEKYPRIAISPDAVISETEAVECKCLSSARHVEAIITKKIPSEYWYQVVQYFVVNEKLETLYFVFYDPRIPVKPYFCVEVKRADVQGEAEELLAYQVKELEEIDKCVAELTKGTDLEF